MPSVVQSVAERLGRNVERVLVGKRAVVELAVVSLLCEGHLLIEDVPGIGKTTLARALAQSIGGTFRRLQCTPDLLPSDVTGVSVFDQRTADFVFRPGPIFANVLLADEINRATPRTQSAVLEAMQEAQVSVDGVTRGLPRPFVVLATQNPVELEGTFPLPEAQLDRFLMRLSLGYPERSGRGGAGDARHGGAGRNAASPWRPARRCWRPSPRAAACACRRTCATTWSRSPAPRARTPTCGSGASPRATLALHRAAQAWAAMQGRDFVLPDDVKAAGRAGAGSSADRLARSAPAGPRRGRDRRVDSRHAARAGRPGPERR